MTSFELMWRQPHRIGRLLNELVTEARSIGGYPRLRERLETTEHQDVIELLVALGHREAARAEMARLEGGSWDE